MSDRDPPRVTIRKLVEASDEQRPLLPRHMTSPAELAQRAAALDRLMTPALETLAHWLGLEARARAEAARDAFEAVFEDRPVRDNRGGSGLNDSFWLFVLARAVDPALIIESGSHKGHSSWLFRQACPKAELHSFDISWDKLEHRAEGAKYHLHDWSEADLSSHAGKSSLVFLDDHINHARRIEEAHDRGFRLLLLDDNFPAYQLHATGGPPVPTLAMLLDPSLEDGREITWTRNGKAYGFVFREAEAAPARALVARHLVLPELAPVTAYSPGSGLTLVKLVD